MEANFIPKVYIAFYEPDADGVIAHVSSLSLGTKEAPVYYDVDTLGDSILTLAEAKLEGYYKNWYVVSNGEALSHDTLVDALRWMAGNPEQGQFVYQNHFEYNDTKLISLTQTFYWFS